jgi:putative phosphoribosyl transferase
MRFADRKDAGRRLAGELVGRISGDELVLAVPKGGVEVGAEMARILGLDFGVIICRKLPFPRNPESGFGAVAEDGSICFTPHARRIPDHLVRSIVEAQKQEIERRIDMLREGDPLPDVAGRRVIITDDGIAMGSTMRAAVMCCRAGGAARIAVTVPVASPAAIAQLESLADGVVVLLAPEGFRAVADAYRNWYDVPDAEAVELLRSMEKR